LLYPHNDPTLLVHSFFAIELNECPCHNIIKAIEDGSDFLL